MATTTATSKPTPPVKRMGLDAITEGPRETPWVILVYGPEGVGKSSLAVDLEDHISLDIEQSANQLRTRKFPTPLTLAEVYEAIQTLYSQDHRYRRLVIDTIDRLEALIYAHIVAQAQRSNSSIRSVEDFGYGKGYQIALDEWRRLVARLDELRSVRHMDILLIGHTFVRPFRNPDGPDYDRYVLRVHEKAGGFLKEWSDAVLFARFEEGTARIDGSPKPKGVMTGGRSLYTVRSAAYDAKNRFGLPEQLPLDWRLLEEAMVKGLRQKREAST